jgi:uncharacterized protein (TIGR02646 family)
MRNIKKNAEPHTLTEHRLQPHADYDNYTDKDTLRQQLVEEQRGLCCYCQSRIRPTSEGMKIEHWQCQERYPQRQLEYRNFLGACLGGHGRPTREQHCDTRKGNTDIRLSPADPACDVERLIQFLGDGRIKSDNPDIDADLNGVLNLNWTRLVNNRKAVLVALQEALRYGRVTNPAQELLKWNGSHAGELPEFSQVVVYYLKKKLRGVAA